MVSSLYPITRRLTPVDGTIGWVGSRRLDWPGFGRKGQRLADAVAVAGLAAVEEERRRAVVLVLGPDAEDGSLLSPAEATAFLAQLRVPLRVWSFGRRAFARGREVGRRPDDRDGPPARRRRLRPAREPLEPEDRLGRGDVASPDGRPGRLRGRDPSRALARRRYFTSQKQWA